jgi:hypothetical protein
MVSAKQTSISPVSPRSTLPLDEKNQIREDYRRSEMKKFLTIVGLLTVIATPAFAQSFNPDRGTGNVLPFAYAADAQSNAYAKGDDAFAMAPGEKTNLDTYSPANTGGGSEGYNWYLAHVR